jgi:uncharacterized protein
MSKNPVVHFEMGYFDGDRMKRFYESAFGWKMNQLGAEMGNYVVAHTAETDEQGMVKTTGTIMGAFTRRMKIRCLMLLLSLYLSRTLV